MLSKLSGLCMDLFGKSPAVGANIVAINGVFNCCGRLVLPAISDAAIWCFKLEPAFGRKLIFGFTLAAQTMITQTLPYIIRNKLYDWFLVDIFFLTITYAGGFGSIPCFLTDMFGAYNIGAMHGLILTAWSIGAVAGGIGMKGTFRHFVHSGMLAADAYISIMHMVVIVLIVGFVFMLLVRTNPRDRLALGYQYSVYNKPVIQIGGNQNATTLSGAAANEGQI